MTVDVQGVWKRRKKSTYSSWSWRELLDYGYSFGISVAVFAALGWGLFGESDFSWVTDYIALLLALVLLAAVRFGIWQGPVSFTNPDCALLLTSPIPHRAFVRPLIVRALGLAFAAGALLGFVVALICNQVNGHGVLRMALSCIGFGLYGVCVIAVSWHVQRCERLTRLAARATPTVGFIVLALIALATVFKSQYQMLALWSGPWGWPLLSMTGDLVSAGLATALIAILALLTGWTALRKTESSLENFRARAQTRSTIGASLFVLDARTAAVTRRGAGPTRRLARARIPRPGIQGFAIAWRDLTSYVRFWQKTVVVVLVMCAGGYLIFSGSDTPVWLPFVGALLAYLGASKLLEPLRLEVDVSVRALIFFPRSLGQILWQHCRLPILFAAVSLTLGALVAALLGTTSTSMAVAAVLLSGPTAGLLVLSAALTARRGGRIPIHVLLMSMSDPSGGIAFILGWATGWLLTGVFTVGVCCWLLRLAGSSIPTLALCSVIVAVVVTVIGVGLRYLLTRERPLFVW